MSDLADWTLGANPNPVADLADFTRGYAPGPPAAGDRSDFEVQTAASPAGDLPDHTRGVVANPSGDLPDFTWAIPQATTWRALMSSFDPIYWWIFDDVAGSTAFHNSGSQANGDLGAQNGAVTAAMSVPTGDAVALELAVGGDAAYSNTLPNMVPVPWTMFGIFYITSWSQARPQGAPIFAGAVNTAGAGCTYFCAPGASASVSVYSGPTDAWPPAVDTYPVTCAEDSWHFAAMSADSTGYVVYLDGLEVGSGSGAFGLPFSYGDWGYCGWGPEAFATPGQMTGWLSNIGCVGAVLTAAQIADLQSTL